MIKKGLFIVLILVVMASSVVAEEKVNLRAIRFNEVSSAGEEVPFFISVSNVYGRKLDDVHVTIDSPDIDIFRSSPGLDIRSGRAGYFIIPVDIPWYISPGDYTIRFTIAYDDDQYRSYYRTILVR